MFSDIPTQSREVAEGKKECTQLVNMLKVKRAPIFAAESENTLVEFVHDRPQIEPLFELPPTMRSYALLPIIK